MQPLPATPVESGDLVDLFCSRVHYACGRHVVPGWLNLDGFEASYPYGSVPPDLARQIYRCDLTQQHPFPDSVFELAYCEDFLEHLSQVDAISFLSEVYRCLRPGGTFRISTPELGAVLAKHYPSADRVRAEAFDEWRHVCFWTAESLWTVARAIGFSSGTKRLYGISTIPELILDSRPDQAALNLVMELVR